MVDLTILENGKLRISWDNEQYDPEGNKEYIEQIIDETGSMWAFQEMLEDNLGNGWSFFTADQLWQLSSCEVLSEDGNYDDNGDIILNGRAWYFPNYMIESPAQTIIDNGYIDFDFWQTFENEVFEVS